MTGRVLGVEIVDEMRGILREPTALFFSILMPVGFFALFNSLFAEQPSGAIPMATRMLATFGTFAVLSVVLLSPGIGVAQDREIGWLRAKRVSAVPVGVTLAAKLAAAVPYAVGVLLTMTIVASLTGSMQAAPAELLAIAGALIVGAVPFALLGLAVGFLVRPNTAAAVLNAILLPSAVVSGLWMPLEIMPDFISRLARFLPTYHLRQVALAQLDGGPVLGHMLVLLATTAVTATAAGVAYRRCRL